MKKSVKTEPKQAKIQLSQQSFDEFTAELHFRINTVRPEIGVRVAEARAMGDLSENAEYHSSRDDQSKNESKIMELEDILKSAIVCEKQISESVIISSIVTLQKNSDTVIIYTVVSAAESDIKNGKLSNESPLGMLLMGKKVGDSFQQTIPIGVAEYCILNIS